MQEQSTQLFGPYIVEINNIYLWQVFVIQLYTFVTSSFQSLGDICGAYQFQWKSSDHVLNTIVYHLHNICFNKSSKYIE